MLTQLYSNDLSTELSDEMVHFAAMIQECLVGTKATENAMYNFLIERNIIDTFINVEALLRIYWSPIISNCCGEKAFSKLKIIKNYLRSVMGQTRLVNLTILSTEHGVLRSINVDNFITNFADIKVRKKLS